MSIFLTKNEQHKMEAQKKADEAKYRNMLAGLSDELVEWLKSKELTVGEFETVVELTRNRLQLTFSKLKIKGLDK